MQEHVGLVRRVEFQIDHHEVGIVFGAKNLVATNAGAPSIGGIAIEELLPFLEDRFEQ